MAMQRPMRSKDKRWQEKIKMLREQMRRLDEAILVNTEKNLGLVGRQFLQAPTNARQMFLRMRKAYPNAS
jgi:hypothetical protein